MIITGIHLIRAAQVGKEKRVETVTIGAFDRGAGGAAPPQGMGEGAGTVSLSPRGPGYNPRKIFCI